MSKPLLYQATSFLSLSGAVMPVGGAAYAKFPTYIEVAHHVHRTDAESLTTSVADDSEANGEQEEVFTRSFECEEDWGPRLEKRFRQLAALEASGSISRAELGELDRLSELRRIGTNPPTPEEVLHRIRQEKLGQELESVLSRYGLWNVSEGAEEE